MGGIGNTLDDVIETDACEWKQDFDGNYDTDCDQSFTMIDGTPTENHMRFCCYCGKGLLTVPYSNVPEED